jgi:rRNA small subunit pseudouridine methyltransferase Nep1
VLEQSSLELVPKKYWNDESCRVVESRFGIKAENQILDDNFHHGIVQKLPDREKRGRPDIVHFALLDIMSTPAYQRRSIQTIIHTINDEVILVKDGVRLPRTELRFYGVMSKILRKKIGPSERDLFENRGVQKMKELVQSLNPSNTFCLSIEGVAKDLHEFVRKSNPEDDRSTRLWIIGGFARGHFNEDVKALSDEIISISDRPLPAHVVSARLSYEIERSTLN